MALFADAFPFLVANSRAGFLLVRRRGRACDGPLDRKVGAHVKSHLRFDRALDRGARDFAIALRGVTITGREERLVDCDW